MIQEPTLLEKLRTTLTNYPYFINRHFCDGDGDVCFTAGVFLDWCAGPIPLAVTPLDEDHARRLKALAKFGGEIPSEEMFTGLEALGLTLAQACTLMDTNDDAPYDTRGAAIQNLLGRVERNEVCQNCWHPRDKHDSLCKEPK